MSGAIGISQYDIISVFPRGVALHVTDLLNSTCDLRHFYAAYTLFVREMVGEIHTLRVVFLTRISTGDVYIIAYHHNYHFWCVMSEINQGSRFNHKTCLL